MPGGAAGKGASGEPAGGPVRRRRLLTAAGATAAAALLPGCSRGDGRGGLRFLSLAWQQESVAANKRLVAQWNAAHPKARVSYVQGSWASAHDQLLTSFEGGEAPDIIHDASDDLADFAYGGYLADLTGLVSDRLRQDIPGHSWQTTTFNRRVYGVPFLQEPRMIMANRRLLTTAGVRLPTADEPWSWEEFRSVAQRLTRKDTYGVAWPLKEPVSATLNLSLSTGGQLFHRGDDGKVTIRYAKGDQIVPRVIRDQAVTDKSASRSTLGMGGADTLPGFFGDRYAMVPLGFSYRQQITQQAPKGFDWMVLPAPAGPGGDQRQGVSPQTLSIAEDCHRKEDAMAFINFLLRPANMVRLARGDWVLPTGTTALADPALRTTRHGWATGTALADQLRPAPAQSVRGYPEWKDKIATPALQEFYSGAIGEGELEHRLVSDGNRVLARYQR
ncbi:ABC transporter substrate-binding protein [Streptomyces zagrosensis]|uniref:ABC-type glycerol-3-phosphate transport system substrate-binding protein n=1 Tax=Streptomyces zagrosensis TaxID=1042984 RepID=A0A7W9Q9H7_9ACTN|nr:extracellular solute-binding protein [Streptomyces zagrosensis]MBB5936100.1 ABC-type glycerol-3-phosphate transport system substrate-binding protein [Streptomyces zagrosensis]